MNVKHVTYEVRIYTESVRNSGQRAKGQAEVWRDGEQTGDSLIVLAWSCTNFTNFSSTVISVLYRSFRTALLAALSIAPIHWLHCVFERAHNVCERPAHIHGRNIKFTTCMIENRKHSTYSFWKIYLITYNYCKAQVTRTHARTHTHGIG